MKHKTLKSVEMPEFIYHEDFDEQNKLDPKHEKAIFFFFLAGFILFALSVAICYFAFTYDNSKYKWRTIEEGDNAGCQIEILE